MRNFKFLGLMLMAVIFTASAPIVIPSLVPTVAAIECIGGVANEPPGCDVSSNITDIDGILDLMNNIFKYFFYIVLTLSSIMLLYAAFKYIWSKGDPGEVETAKNIIIYAVIALIVSGIAYAVPAIILQFVAQ